MSPLLLVAPYAAALINWQGLGLVAAFALVTGLVIVGAFSIGVLGLDRWSAARDGSARAGRQPEDRDRRTVPIVEAAMPVGVERSEVAYVRWR
jgi:hypothetical protein